VPEMDGSVVRCCISTTCAPPNVVLYRRMRAAHAKERRGAKGTHIPLMSLAQGGGVVQRIHVSMSMSRGTLP